MFTTLCTTAAETVRRFSCADTVLERRSQDQLVFVVVAVVVVLFVCSTNAGI